MHSSYIRRGLRIVVGSLYDRHRKPHPSRSGTTNRWKIYSTVNRSAVVVAPVGRQGVLLSPASQVDPVARDRMRASALAAYVGSGRSLTKTRFDASKIDRQQIAIITASAAAATAAASGAAADAGCGVEGTSLMMLGQCLVYGIVPGRRLPSAVGAIACYEPSPNAPYRQTRVCFELLTNVGIRWQLLKPAVVISQEGARCMRLDDGPLSIEPIVRQAAPY